MVSLYLSEQGSQIGLKDNRLVISKSKETLKEISLEKVDNIVIIDRKLFTRHV